MEGARDVLYFTHDYFSMTSDKNSFIQSTAKVAKKVGAERFVAVCPIEYDHYYSEEKTTPLEYKNEA